MRRLIVVLVACFAIAACSPSAEEVIDETAAAMPEITSGELDLSMSAQTAEGEATAGFSLSGPFQLPEPGGLPVADLLYEPKDGEPVRFVSDGASAFLVVGDDVIEVPEEQAAGLRGGDSAESNNVIAQLDVSSWFVGPELSTGDGSGGDEVDRVTGELDAATAITDLVELVNRFGAALPELTSEDQEQIAAAVDSAGIEMATGAEDRLLRELTITIDLQAQLPPDLQSLDVLSGVAIDVQLSIRNPNEEIARPVVPPEA